MADIEKVELAQRKFDKKLIVDYDDDLSGKLSALAIAAERSNAWVVRRLIEAAHLRVFPGAEFSTGVKPSLDALKKSGLLGLDIFYRDDESR